jgi:hypothetical protein
MKDPLEGYIGATPEYEESDTVPGERLKNTNIKLKKLLKELKQKAEQYDL